VYVNYGGQSYYLSQKNLPVGDLITKQLIMFNFRLLLMAPLKNSLVFFFLTRLKKKRRYSNIPLRHRRRMKKFRKLIKIP